jgi:hypothetical protein
VRGAKLGVSELLRERLDRREREELAITNPC